VPYNTFLGTKITTGNSVLWAVLDTSIASKALEVWRWIDPKHEPEVYRLNCLRLVGHECRISNLAADEELSLWMDDFRVEQGDDRVVRRVKLRRDPNAWHVDATEIGRLITDHAPRDGKMRVPEATTDEDGIPDDQRQPKPSRAWYETNTERELGLRVTHDWACPATFRRLPPHLGASSAGVDTMEQSAIYHWQQSVGHGPRPTRNRHKSGRFFHGRASVVSSRGPAVSIRRGP
jgi:hypothetical protein